MFPLDALERPGARGSVEGDGPGGGLTVPRRRGPGSQLRRRQAGRREAGQSPRLEARPGDQGEPGLAADTRPAGGARGGEDPDHGRAAPPRRPPLPPARAEEALEEGDQGGGDDQGGAAPRARRRLDELPEIDLVLCGAVAVNLSGARAGKGGGFSDLEYGILIDAGKIDSHTTVATTVHPIQIVRQHVMMTAHDLPVDVIATPRAVIEVERQYERPRGILWDHLQPPQIREIPVLERMGYA